MTEKFQTRCRIPTSTDNYYYHFVLYPSNHFLPKAHDILYMYEFIVFYNLFFHFKIQHYENIIYVIIS